MNTENWIEPIEKTAYEEIIRTCEFKRPDGYGWLSDGVEITDATVTVEPNGGGDPIAEMISDVAPYNNTQVKYTLKGGEAGTRYWIKIQITTSDNQKMEARGILNII